MNDDINILDPSTPILIVDDNPQYLQVLSKILESAFGYTSVRAVATQDEAYKLLMAEPTKYKLLFVDYRFPNGQNGTDFLARLKTENMLDDKVAFLITSEPSPENLQQAVAAGAQALIAKPFDREQLKIQLQRAERYLWAKTREYF